MRLHRALVVGTCLLALSGRPLAQFDSVGTLQFPTSGSPEAQQHFLRGVAILHSFGWKQAIAEFQAAQKLQPDFAMAYWGETLCYNHPLTPEQNVDSPRKVLGRLGLTPAERLTKAPTDREKGFLQAVELLWGDGDYRTRRIRYMEAMGRLYERYPRDPEVALFYAVALLSGARAIDDGTFRLEMQAGAIAQGIFADHPNHPGAAHYTIHAFDDPVHAPLALRAARAYAKIAPAVSHARHMPTHIFIQHGMWNEVATQNASAYEAARDRWQPGDSVGDMLHALDWGQYGYLQLGDYRHARESIDLIQQVLDRSDAGRGRGTLNLAKARYIVESGEWKIDPVSQDTGAETLLAIGMTAAKRGDLATAAEAEARLKTIAEKRSANATSQPAHDHGAAGGTMAGLPENAKSAAVMVREVAALVRLAKGNEDDAVARLTEAVRIEEEMRPPNGAADPIKPAHELLGEVLLEIGRPAEAVKQFEIALQRMPNRSLSLLGIARAYAKNGDRQRASEHYRKLAANWKDRESLPGFQEAKRFLSSEDP